MANKPAVNGLYQFQWPTRPVNAADMPRWERDFEWAHRAFVDRLNADRAKLEERIEALEKK